jgi:membrane-associated protease RseP (regulator of RpoE activity)
MCKKLSMLLSVAAILLAGVNSLSAADAPASRAPNNSNPPKATAAPTNPQQNATAQAQKNERAFLGVAFQPVPKALESQLSTAFPDLARGTGAMITNVMPNSPAAKAGIKPYDIVTEINHQSLKSTGDLGKTIARESAGQTVTMQVVRASKAEELKVTLGERPTSAVIRGQSPAETSAPNGQKSDQGQPSANHSASANDRASAKGDDVELESFDALTLERTGKDQYKAEIKFRDKEGKVETCLFKGSRDEIRKDIDAQQNLPKSERHQLLGSLRLPVDFELAPGSNAAPDDGT